MNAQIPIPSFDDIRKLLSFWIGQQDKWFYFETGMVQIGRSGETQKEPTEYAKLAPSWDKINEIIQYSQLRIIGKIHDVVEYPPSLLLHDVTIFTADTDSYNRKGNLVDTEKRKQYGLVFSQVSYYEPIDDVEFFISSDVRVKSRKK